MAGVQVEPVSSSEDCSREEPDNPPDTRTDPLFILTAAAAHLGLSSGVAGDQVELTRLKHPDRTRVLLLRLLPPVIVYT